MPSITSALTGACICMHATCTTVCRCMLYSVWLWCMNYSVLAVCIMPLRTWRDICYYCYDYRKNLAFQGITFMLPGLRTVEVICEVRDTFLNTF